MQARYATQVLGYPVWGRSPSSTSDDTGGYGGFGVEGPRYFAADPESWGARVYLSTERMSIR